MSEGGGTPFPVVTEPTTKKPTTVLQVYMPNILSKIKTTVDQEIWRVNYENRRHPTRLTFTDKKLLTRLNRMSWLRGERGPMNAYVAHKLKITKKYAMTFRKKNAINIWGSPREKVNALNALKLSPEDKDTLSQVTIRMATSSSYVIRCVLRDQFKIDVKRETFRCVRHVLANPRVRR